MLFYKLKHLKFTECLLKTTRIFFEIDLNFSIKPCILYTPYSQTWSVESVNL